MICDCDFQKNDGQWKVYHNGVEIFTDWYNENYDWLKEAIYVITKMKEQHQTLDRLTTIRRALREDCVQGWRVQDYYIYDYIERNKTLTLKQLNVFLEIARENDEKHHEEVTF